MFLGLGFGISARWQPAASRRPVTCALLGSPDLRRRPLGTYRNQRGTALLFSCLAGCLAEVTCGKALDPPPDGDPEPGLLPSTSQPGIVETRVASWQRPGWTRPAATGTRLRADRLV